MAFVISTVLVLSQKGCYSVVMNVQISTAVAGGICK